MKSRFQLFFISLIVMPAVLLLSACGGGSGGDDNNFGGGGGGNDAAPCADGVCSSNDVIQGAGEIEPNGNAGEATVLNVGDNGLSGIQGLILTNRGDDEDIYSFVTSNFERAVITISTSALLETDEVFLAAAIGTEFGGSRLRAGAICEAEGFGNTSCRVIDEDTASTEIVLAPGVLYYIEVRGVSFPRENTPLPYTLDITFQ